MMNFKGLTEDEVMDILDEKDVAYNYTCRNNRSVILYEEVVILFVDDICVNVLNF